MKVCNEIEKLDFSLPALGVLIAHQFLISTVVLVQLFYFLIFVSIRHTHVQK